MKLKDWKFSKHRTKKDLEMVVAEGEISAREEGKDSAFIHNGCLISPSNNESFKRGESAMDSNAMWANRGKYY
jgi:hypothetical protein